VARALVSAGLLPALGIHHSNRSNAFCLADDLVEPLRPMADAQVRELYRQGHTELGQPTKAKLLALLTQEVLAGEQRGPLMVALHRMAASLVACYRGEARQLLIPTATGEAIL
jgi:CRISPR-associated protein Cas1